MGFFSHLFDAPILGYGKCWIYYIRKFPSSSSEPSFLEALCQQKNKPRKEIEACFDEIQSGD